MSMVHARTARLIGPEGMRRLAAARIAVFGLGGVGGAAAWALSRCGVGALRLIDCDVVAESNLNRQMVADWETIGLPKTAAAERMIRRYNREVELELMSVRAAEDNIPGLCAGADVVIDAIDDVDAKEALAVHCVREGVELLSCMGTGNKLSPSGFSIQDLSKTSGDPLARAMRRRLRARGIEHLKVCISGELPRRVEPDEQGGHTPASIAFVPPSAGLTLAGEAVRIVLERG
jgi:tRNA A37 threonylcarbamoyladenosine dehydratase